MRQLRVELARRVAILVTGHHHPTTTPQHTNDSTALQRSACVSSLGPCTKGQKCGTDLQVLHDLLVSMFRRYVDRFDQR